MLLKIHSKENMSDFDKFYELAAIINNIPFLLK
jgi:hypothetical protein